jgi:hypothetical protein
VHSFLSIRSSSSMSTGNSECSSHSRRPRSKSRDDCSTSKHSSNGKHSLIEKDRRRRSSSKSNGRDNRSASEHSQLHGQSSSIDKRGSHTISDQANLSVSMHSSCNKRSSTEMKNRSGNPNGLSISVHSSRDRHSLTDSKNKSRDRDGPRITGHSFCDRHSATETKNRSRDRSCKTEQMRRKGGPKSSSKHCKTFEEKTATFLGEDICL